MYTSDKPIKVTSFTHRMRAGNDFHSIQVSLSNGKASPLFAAPDTSNLTSLTTLQIPDASLIKRIQGTKGSYMHQIIFKKADGSELYRIEAQTNTLGDDHILNDGEEIIGVYGGYYLQCIDALGIIVWIPPKF